jgi:hypothetical protein
MYSFVYAVFQTANRNFNHVKFVLDESLFVK